MQESQAPTGKRGRDPDRGAGRERVRGAGRERVRAAARTVRKARGSTRERTQWIVGIAAVVVLAAVVAVGVAASRGEPAPAGSIPVQQTGGSYPVSVQDGVVISGSGPTTVEIYEDFLCPACGRFETLHADEIEQALAAGRITMRYRLVNMLDRLSRPNGYSLDAANAAICAAEAGVFPRYHASLFDAQPREGGTGYTDEQLVTLGRDLGAAGGFEQCVRSGAHDAQVIANLSGAGAALLSQGGFPGTPAVLLNGKLLKPLSNAAFDKAIGEPAG